MPNWQGKSRGTPLGYRIFVFISRFLGVRSAYFILIFVSFYFFLFSYASSKAIFRYFRYRHHQNLFSSLISIYRSYYVFGQTLLDKMVVMSEINNPFTFEFDGEENLMKMVEMGKGGILLSAHAGNWDAAGHLLQRINTRINVVLYDGEHQQIKNYVNEVTGEKNFKIIAIKDDLSHVFMIGEALQKNEIVCMHADRFLEKNKTISRNLLGKEALFPAGPFTLAAAFNVPVSSVFAFKDSPLHYHLYGSPMMIRNENEQKSEFAKRLADFFVDDLERKLKLYPLQWFNYYNFWND